VPGVPKTEDRADTKAQHHKADDALRAAAMIRAGVDPGLFNGVRWWRTHDLCQRRLKTDPLSTAHF
jgi:hypothetical protein